MLMKNIGITETHFPITANAADWAVSAQNFMRRNKEKQAKYKRAAYFPIVAMMFAPIALISSIFKLNGVMDFVCANRKHV
jgi:hypothetical protein